MIDHNAILSACIDDYKDYSTNTSGVDVEKAIKYSGRNFDLRRRGDIRNEVVVFKFDNGTSDWEIDADKPIELNQNFQAMCYVETTDKQSTREVSYDRLLELCDDLINWSLEVVGNDLDSDIYTITFTSMSDTREEDGFLACEVNFQSILKLQ
jgi:hypothetical protein